MARKLSEKEEAFCQQLLIDNNATQAALRAGYAVKSAKEQACRLLTKDNIKARVAELRAKRAEKVEVTQIEVLRELKNYLYSDITETIGLTPDEIKQLPLAFKRMIAAYKETSRVIGSGDEPIIEKVIEVKFYDKLKVADMINKHIGFYEKDNKQQVTEMVITRKVITG